MARRPRDYPQTIPSAESGRPMQRGAKLLSFRVSGRLFSYNQPGWWCSLSDPDDLEGQLVDEDNQIADMARRSAKALAEGETIFVPVVIRAIRQSCGLSQREAGLLFGAGEKAFEKYESGEISPSGPTKRLLRLALERPDLFRKQIDAGGNADADLALKALRAGQLDDIFGGLFETA